MGSCIMDNLSGLCGSIVNLLGDSYQFFNESFICEDSNLVNEMNKEEILSQLRENRPFSSKSQPFEFRILSTSTNQKNVSE